MLPEIFFLARIFGWELSELLTMLYKQHYSVNQGHPNPVKYFLLLEN